MQRQGYLKNAAIMTATGLILRAAGMFFRVYLAATIGAQGMGVFQLISAVYAMAITCATAGLSLTCARICADFMAQKKEGCLRPAVRKLTQFGFFTAMIAGVILFFTSSWISDLFLKEPRAVASLQIAAFSLPFMAISSCLRGYFLAKRNVMPDSRAQLIEQAARMALVVLLIESYHSADIGKICALITLAGTVSEMLHWLILALAYRKENNIPDQHIPDGFFQQSFQILFPIAANQYLGSFLHSIENIIVPACLAVFLSDRAFALEQYGALKGMAMPVLFFPFSILGTLSTLLMPEIAQAHIQRNQKILQSLISRVLLITSILSIFAGGLFYLFAYDIAEILYHDAQIGFYIQILGPLMPFMYLESMVDGMLKGINEQLSTFRYTLLDLIMRIVLIALLLPHFGMKGFLFVMLASNLFTCSFNFRRLLFVSGVKLQWKNWLFKPLLSCFMMAVCYQFVFVPLLLEQLSQVSWVCIASILLTFFYFLCIWATGCASPKDFALRKKDKSMGRKD